MNKKIRKIATILAHIGLILAIVYLGFFIVCSIRANHAGAVSASQKDLYLSQAMNERDFSFYTVGRALSDSSNPAKENLYMLLDLSLPVLFLLTGIPMQIVFLRKHRNKHPALQQKPLNQTVYRR